MRAIATFATAIVTLSAGYSVRHFAQAVQGGSSLFTHTGLAVSILSVVLALHAFQARRLNRNLKHMRALRREVRDLVILRVEHEQLIDMLCDIKGIKRGDLPTRHTDGTLRAPMGTGHLHDDDEEDL